MELIIIRHAIAEDQIDFAKISENDELRPLTKDGIQRMKKNMLGIKRLVKSPDVIFTSPLVRAQQTTEIVKGFYSKVEIKTSENLKPESHPKEIIEELFEKCEENSVIVVGHQPHLGELISFSLTGNPNSDFHIKKGGLCVLDFPQGPIAGTADLRCFIQPKQLRQIGKD